MRKQNKTEENIEKHGKTRRIKEKQRKHGKQGKTWGNRRKRTETLKNREN